MRFQTSADVKLSLEHSVLDIGATSSFDMLPGLVQEIPINCISGAWCRVAQDSSTFFAGSRGPRNAVGFISLLLCCISVEWFALGADAL